MRPTREQMATLLRLAMTSYTSIFDEFGNDEGIRVIRLVQDLETRLGIDNSKVDTWREIGAILLAALTPEGNDARDG
jgi:hypothetical protein